MLPDVFHPQYDWDVSETGTHHVSEAPVASQCQDLQRRSGAAGSREKLVSDGLEWDIIWILLDTLW